MYQLIIKNNYNEQLTFSLSGKQGSRFSIGRSEDCDFALPQEVHLSRLHCYITLNENEILLSDNNSSNGIYEDNERVSRIIMQVGKEYGMGDCTISIRPTKQSAPTPSHKSTGTGTPRKFIPPPPRKAPVKRPVPRPFYTAAGTLNTETPSPEPRKLKAEKKENRGHVTRMPSMPATELGLPHDFDLSFRLQNTEANLRHGDLLRFTIQASKACFVYLIQYDSENNAAMLLPGVGGAENKLTSMHPLSVPPVGKDSGYELYVEEPYGNDTIIAIACSVPCKFEKTWARCLDLTDALLRRPGEVELSAIQRCKCPEALWSAAVLNVTTG